MLALQALCVYDALGDDFADQLGAFLHDPYVHEDLALKAPLAEDVIEFAERLVTLTRARLTELDTQLQAAAAHWSLARITPVDRNVLRLGLCEMQSVPDTPLRVALNEAIELARRFGDTESPRFVNGILDAIPRDRDADERSASDSQAPSASANGESPPA